MHVPKTDFLYILECLFLHVHNGLKYETTKIQILNKTKKHQIN